jgi:dipeptidyl aminopeptidase/acylaminoacyl peptidase
MAEGGSEEFRLYRRDFATGASVAFSPEGERAILGGWSRKGDRIAFTTSLVDRNNPDRTARTRVHVVDPAEPHKGRVAATLEGGSWASLRFSEDGRRLVFIESVSSTDTRVWILDIASGQKRRVAGGGREPVAYRDPYFSRDGKGLYVTSDKGGEYRRLVYLPLGGGAEKALTAHLKHDVENFEISFDANLIAFVTNERGNGVLRFIDLKTSKELPRPPLVDGVIGGLEWRRGSSEVGFHISSARSAGDVFSYDVKENRLTRWTNGNNPELNTSAFVEPRLVAWKSFDGLEISGFHYHPPARFAGKRPVIVNIHGGPAAQARPGFNGRNNYYTNELGIAMIYPNVRGSSGFGKTFLKLDDGRKREDSVKDIGALLDWIAAQPDLDAGRVMVMGGSYGGYMALACAFHYADRIAGAVSTVGISNFVTFLERTESYRRDNRRAEYGDERDPAMRAFLESISPLSHAARMTRPMLIMQGRNDPRVPYTESEQIVATLRSRGTPVWFMMASDEGHGFARRPNADYAFYAITEFARRNLLQ